MKKRIDVSLVLPCYNEAVYFTQSVEHVVRVLKRSGLSFEIIFVDDHGQDNTQTLIDTFVKNHSSFAKAIHHTVNIGRGRTVIDGIMKSTGIVVGFIDLDCEVSPVYIPELADLILEKKADVVIGKRIYRTGTTSIMREIFSIGYQKISDMMVGTGGLDTETGYKFFNRKKILPILKQTTHPHWFWDTEVMVYSRLAGLRVMEIPVLFLRRTDKQSSVRVVRDIMDYLINLWKFRQTLQH